MMLFVNHGHSGGQASSHADSQRFAPLIPLGPLPAVPVFHRLQLPVVLQGAPVARPQAQTGRAIVHLGDED